MTEHRGADGQVTGITERFAMRVSGGKTNVTEIHRRSDGSIISTERETVEERYPKDGKGGSADTAAASDPGKKTGGNRSPEEISNGGPGGGPSIKVVSGVTTLDLLRQHADGSGPRGGGLYDIRANGVDQVRPVGEEQQGGVVGSKTPPVVEGIDPLGNPGTAGEGGDRPD